VLTKALESGIHVVGYDADSVPQAREWFVNPAESKGIAKAMVDSLVAEQGEDASFGIVTSSSAHANQARWIAEMQAYAEACYPNLTWLETLESQGDVPSSFSATQALLEKYGDGIKGIFSMSSVATPAAAEAVTQAGACGTVSVVGLATPNAMKPFVETDCVKHVVLWNPVDLGYAAVYVARAVADGKFAPGDTSVSAGRLGDLQVVDGSEVLLGPPFIYTAENIDDFDF
jgi:ABC-type sugar transport system substrate-binding protein